MAKDPAVLWYWNDWHGGTITLSRHLKGCYMDLLHAQFNNGHLSISEIQTVLGIDFSAAWAILHKKFKQDEVGLFFNERLVFESDKRKNYSKSRQNNLKGKKESPHMEAHMSPHMENDIDNVIEFDIVFDNWIKYKKGKNQTYRTSESLTACRNKLIKLSQGKYSTAKEIVEESMSNNWAGLFPLRADHNGTPKLSAENIKENVLKKMNDELTTGQQ